MNAKTRGSAKRGEPQRYVRGHWSRGPRTILEPPNPSGICQCGCGQPAPIAAMTSRLHGWAAGKPLRFIQGHAGYLKRRDRLTSDLWIIEDRGFTSPCWIWNGQSDTNGYARFKYQGRRQLAHRAVYEQEVGPIRDGLDIDHLCRVRNCVNPTHLEAVTRAVNIQRSRTAKLTAEDVRFIRGSSLSNPRLAALFAVSTSTITSIRSGKNWRSVE